MPYRHGSNSGPAMPPARLSLCDPAEPMGYYLAENGAMRGDEREFDEVRGWVKPGETVYPQEDTMMARWGSDHDDEKLYTVWLVPVSVVEQPPSWKMAGYKRVLYRVQRDEPLEDDIEPLMVPKEVESK